jgi:serine/threonine-protein kinase RsbW
VIFLRVPAALTYRDLVTRAVEAAYKIATSCEGFNEPANDEVVSELVSAVGEGFNNAVIHAYRGTEGGEVSVQIATHGRTVEITISDAGQSFDFQAVPPPDLAALPESGMGLFIIRSFVDEVSYDPGPPNVLRMRKHL